VRTLIMTKGLPASGKTTWAKEQVAKDPKNIKRINKDDLRVMLHASVWSKSLENDIIETRDLLICFWLSQDKTVIVDDTNIQPAHEPRLRDLAEMHESEFKIQDFTDVPLNVCLKRDSERANFVGEKVIKTMFNTYLRNKGHVVQYQPIEQNPDLADAIIVDIDGTLAHMNGRSPYDYSKVDTDIVDPIVSEMVRRYHSDGLYVVICSGREDACREVTEKWLADNNIPYNAILMRTTGDHRKDAIVKRELYEANIKPHYNVKFVLDDRDQVVKMWREVGLKVLQVAEGDF
jgi:predicted kinase